MNTIEVMRKALEALEHPQAGLVPHQGEWRSRTSLAIDALRAELERLEAVEPVVWGVTYHASGEPTDLFFSEDEARIEAENCGWTARVVPLYTAPIAPSIPALTNEELDTELLGQQAKLGHTTLRGTARWAYALAAERAGVAIK